MSEKRIFFYPFGNSSQRLLSSWYGTTQAIQSGQSEIRTTSMINLSFDLIEKYGYDIFLVGDIGQVTQIRPKMPELDRELRLAHNLKKLFLAGIFNHLIYSSHTKQCETLSAENQATAPSEND